MRIAQLAPPFETVPPPRYGGTERVISVLTEELVRRGHDVTLFASADSTTTARLVPTVDRAVWHHEPPYGDLGAFWSIVLGRLMREMDRFDVVHSHLDLFGLPAGLCAPCPFVTTLHGRLDLPEVAAVLGAFPEAPLVSISDAQRRPLPEANWVATVHNGIDIGRLTLCAARGSYLVFLGRVSPQKGLDIAIRVARRAGWPLKIAARMPLPFDTVADARSDWRYYQDVILPLLGQGGDVEFVGEVGGTYKADLLGGAAALLFPIQWPEPFGLVVPEAMACGTPVVALRNGSVPELVDDGVTGFVRDDEDGLVEAIERLGEIDRRRCRLEVERRFSPAVMADGYERVYEALLLDHPAAMVQA